MKVSDLRAILSHVSPHGDVTVIQRDKTPPRELKISVSAHQDRSHHEIAVDVYDVTEEQRPHYLATVVIYDPQL